MGRSHKAQHGFIDRACQGEPEVGVLGKHHVGEVLVRECFKNSRRHFGASRFGIVAVPQIASNPFAVSGCEVLCYTIEQSICKACRHLPGCSRVEPPVVEVGGADGERPHQVSTLAVEAGIAVHGQREFYGHLLALQGWNEHRAARQPVCHERAHVDVVFIVVGSLLRAVNAVGGTGPLRIVASPLEGSGQLAHFAPPFYIAHATAKAHGIGGYEPVVAALVAHHHTVLFVKAGIEVEGAKVYPCAAAHLLVHTKVSGLPLVVNGVVCIGNAALNGLVAHIHGIAPFFFDVWLIGGHGQVFALGSGEQHACRAHGKGVLPVGEHTAGHSKPAHAGVHPGIAALGFAVRGSGAVVVVNHHLFGLPVAFAWSEHVGTGIFEHGNQVGHHNGGGEQVFGGAEQVGALPLPPAFLLVEVAAVAGPEREVAVGQPLCNFVGLRNVLHPRLSLIFCFSPLCLLCPCLSSKEKGRGKQEPDLRC